jgi:hypothetical protein
MRIFSRHIKAISSLERVLAPIDLNSSGTRDHVEDVRAGMCV